MDPSHYALGKFKQPTEGPVGRSVWLEAGRKLEQVRVGATQALGGSWRDL